jgi:hypothetical protein
MSYLRTQDRPTPAPPVRRPVTTLVGGAFVVVCAVTSALAMELPNWLVETYAPRPDWSYSPAMWPLLVALTAAGVVVMTKHRWSRPAAVVAAIMAAQVAGGGLTATRNWFGVFGLGGLDKPSLVSFVSYAVVVSLAAGAAAMTATALVWREPTAGLLPARPWYVAAGLAVVVLLPMAWEALRGNWQLTASTHISALMYSLPLGVGLAAAGWLRGRTGKAALVTVVVSAVVCTAIAVVNDWYVWYTTPVGD